MGVGWTVEMKKEQFVGRPALKKLTNQQWPRQIVGLEISLANYEYLFHQVGLPPQIPLTAWRGGVPVYKEDRDIGHATTGVRSPTLQQYLALATVDRFRTELCTELDM